MGVWEISVNTIECVSKDHHYANFTNALSISCSCCSFALQNLGLCKLVYSRLRIASWSHILRIILPHSFAGIDESHADNKARTVEF